MEKYKEKVNPDEEGECIFCKMVVKDESMLKKNKIIAEDDTFIAFYDIKPDAEFHILVIPKLHRLGVDKLTGDDIDFLNEMQVFGKNITIKEAGEEKSKSAIYGFHRPPFNSIKHLHMHCLAGNWNKLLSGVSFTSYGFWFISTQSVLNDITRRKNLAKK